MRSAERSLEAATTRAPAPRLSTPTPAEIRACRLSVRWTQTDAARALHLSLRAYQGYEHGTATMHPCYWFVLRALTERA